MNPDALSQPLRVLRACLHLLFLALLALAIIDAVTEDADHVTAIVIVSIALAAGYAAGPALPVVRRSRTAAVIWLSALTAGWLVLLALTPDGIWVAFPLFLLQLHLLPTRPGLLAVLLTTITAIAGYSWHQEAFEIGAVIGPGIGAAVAVATVLGYQTLYKESDQRRQLIEQLTATRAELAAAERSAGVLAERERLAREIHDTLAQGLSSIQLLLRAAQRASGDDPEAAAGHVEHARQTAQDNLVEARRFVRALVPPDLEHGSLPAALSRLCETTTERSATTAHFQVEGVPAALNTPYEVALLRIAQSAVANAIQHAGATRVKVTLSYLDTSVVVDVVDDGVGFDPTSEPATGNGGFGLTAMRERASELGGSLSVESSPGEGTAVAISFPLPCGEPAVGQP